MQLFSNILPVENFNTSNFPGDNVKDEHPLIGCQGDVPVTRAVGTNRLRLRVKRGAEVVPAVATVEDTQARHLCGQFGFALLDEKFPKLGCERWKRIREEQSFFGWFRHWMFWHV
jgi:hypothetical protein